MAQEIAVAAPEGRDSSEHGVATLGNSIIFNRFDHDGVRTMWVGRVEPG